ncbi:chromosomal replication initiator DnaA [Marivivens marinus]|uniref:chromosomal replication initiator DnaA n=1 Tax=Marivivens marinus TaxID=3110173 RepID=UPI003B84B6FA
MSEQLSFDWPARVALGREDFFVSEANARAFATVTAPDSWPEGKLAVVGPKGSGKTHLARVFAQANAAMILNAADLTPASPLPEARAVVIEDVERLSPEAEEWLFHLHNALKGRGRLLLTSDRAPARWQLALPDLASRMQATNLVSIDDPDDRLLSAVIMKQFQDRQIAPSPGLAAYLAARIERSFAAAADVVDQIDRAALARSRKVNEALAREVLDNTPDAG